MNADLDPTLLAELRELHQSEHAPAELERSVLERVLPARNKVPLRARLRAWWSRVPLGIAVLSAAASVAVLGGVYLTLPGVHEPSREPIGDDHIALGREPAKEAARDARGAVRCPIDDLPPGFAYEATRSDMAVALTGLELDTFAMPIPGCPDLVRRSLSYVPQGLTRGPVLIVLHDGGDSAESVRALRTQGSFEALAERDRFIVVYANAAPAVGPFPNSGVWQTDLGANRAIDDVGYLARVVERLGQRAGPDVYLVGYGSGAQLALEAAAQHPERYAGVAALLPDKLNHSRPPARPANTRLKRLLFVTVQGGRPWVYWPGVPLDVNSLDDWTTAMGLPDLSFQQGLQPDTRTADQPMSPALPGLHHVVPAGTRLLDVGEPDEGGSALRVLVVPRKEDLDVGEGGSPAPLDVATLAWEFFLPDVPGYPGGEVPQVRRGAAP
jgi:pimeloyl-ACP methyl ester carboxylesterase